jgi:adhesin transport system outer membrane protein
MVIMKKTLLLSCCSLVLAGVSLPVAMPASAETLQEAVSTALSVHPSIEAAVQAREIASETKREQRSAYFPEINASASAGRIYGDNSTSRGLTVSRGATYSGLGEGSASITQPLFKGFETLNRVRAADARMKSEEYNIADARESLAFQAVQAYWGLFHSERLLAKVTDYKKTTQDYLDRIQMMVDEGAADESETAQAHNLLLSLETSAIDYEGQVEAALANYRQVMGSLPRSSLQEPMPIGHIVPETPEKALTISQTDHPLLMALDRNMQASNFDVKAERGALFPSLDAELSAYKKDQKEEIGGEVEDGRALLKMNWLFNTGGAQFARMDRARAERSELLARKQETILQIEGDIRRAYAEMKTAQKQMAIIEERKAVTQELLDAYETQFEGGRVRLLQLMQSENQVFGVDVERLDADYRYKLAEYSVLASMGKLNQYLAEIPSMPLQAVKERPAVTQVSEVVAPAEPSVPVVSQKPTSLSRSAMEERIFTGSSK